ncbi:MAG TPA: VOC family protein [Desertimonas sp.]|nr:VOC family protein [Desertimonas sp.]
MQITGLGFVGTRTPRRAEMAAFLRDVLRLDASVLPDVDIDLFQLPDGSSFAVVDATEPQRTVGFTVADLDNAVMELRHAGIETDHEVSSNRRFRYAHFRAPDGQLYELIEPTNARNDP